MPSSTIRAAERVKSLVSSPTVTVSEQARKLKSQGIDVIDLGGGDPDFPTPGHISEALRTSLATGNTHYVESAGTTALREAIARKLETDNKIVVDPAGEILVTPGGKAALFQAMLAWVDVGVDVMLLDPAWVSYAPMVEMAGGRPVRVPLDQKDNYQISADILERYRTPSTRVLLVNSPNNPTGRVLTDQEAASIAAFSQKHDLLVFSDEIYEKIIYDGRKHLSLASLPGMDSRTLTFNGFSKAYAMTGWRLGYVAGRSELLKEILKVHSHSTTCVTAFAQPGGVAALQGPQDIIDEMVGHWARRRQFICRALSAVKGIHCPAPEGAFYAWADASGTGLDSIQLAEKLLRDAHVAVTPGAAFGSSASHHIRLSFATSDVNIEKAVDRIAHCLN